MGEKTVTRKGMKYSKEKTTERGKKNLYSGLVGYV